MEERRIERVCEAMRSSAEAERKVLPAAGRSLEVMMEAAEGIQPRMPPPPPQPHLHLGAWPAVPSLSPTASREPITQRLNDLMTSGSRTRKQCLRSLKRGLSLKLVSSKPSTVYMNDDEDDDNDDEEEDDDDEDGDDDDEDGDDEDGDDDDGDDNDDDDDGDDGDGDDDDGDNDDGSGPADCSHLPPEQRRKKLQSRMNNINQEIQREREQRDALLKMREVYERSPQMGDAGSLEPRLEEAWFSEADSRLSENGSRRQSGGCGSNSQVTTPGSSSLKQLDNRSPASRESPDGSYTEDNSAELHFKSRSSEFDDDFDDEEPLPSIGTCKSLYPFQGQNEGTLSMVEGELLSVVEEDKGDGWTRVRRNLEEEGYVPTSYIKVFLESSAKGAMTYI
ncbi:Formin-binding protein 1 like [Dissostichus eleginoides]|uniref:Formin-binding protein 1 like n=1 Tax=Dissostichus eleginoides TaxID=100907 RepID=A0AAD9ESM6_DISEL|nr:Formin-binding protein 1 like [Dissostichus eleginoides]